MGVLSKQRNYTLVIGFPSVRQWGTPGLLLGGLIEGKFGVDLQGTISLDVCSICKEYYSAASSNATRMVEHNYF